jgi:Flp pilus assembly pilin Flp
MKSMVSEFLRDDRGQDLMEYTLLMAFVCLTSVALFVGDGTIWTSRYSELIGANTAAG